MKNLLQFISLAAVALLMLMGCGPQSKEHAKEADENLNEAGENIIEATKDADAEVKAKATADWQAFKNDSDRSIAAMEKQASALKAKIAKADKKTKADVSNELAKLEQKLNEQKTKLDLKNAEFENDLNNFNASIQANNELFRKEFTHDINGLGTAFNDLLQDNVK